MKRDADLVRKLLLHIEKHEIGILRGREIALEGYEYSEIMGHLNMLADAGYLVAEYSKSSTNPNRIIATEFVFDLSWAGHEYLDTVRDAKIWRQTKASARKAGAMSFEFLLEIAKGIARAELAKQTGLTL